MQFLHTKMINNFAYYGYDAANTQTRQRLGTRIMQVDQRARAELLEVVEAGDIPIETPSADITSLQPANPNANSHSNSNTGTATDTDIYYYSVNHLGSTAFTTDANATIMAKRRFVVYPKVETPYPEESIPR